MRYSKLPLIIRCPTAWILKLHAPAKVDGSMSKKFTIKCMIKNPSSLTPG